MLKRGVYVHPWHNMFLSGAMTDIDIDAALDAATGAFSVLKAKRATIKPSQKLQAFFAPIAKDVVGT
jgi:glutamate-1-semialdehyde 2,1-aminomutase